MTSFENVQFAIDDCGIATVTITREKALNALNRSTLLELNEAFDSLPEEARVLVLTGGGRKAFVAGADIKELVDLSAMEAQAFSRLGHEVFRKLEDLPIPVIAKVAGFALGGGCELMLACDFAIASEKAQFGQPEVALGVTPGFGGTVRLSRRIGDARARQLLFTGERITADRALLLGLVNEVVAEDLLDERVQEIAKKVAKHSAYAVGLTKRATRVAEECALDIANQFEQQTFGLCFAHPDQKRNMKAFLEK